METLKNIVILILLTVSQVTSAVVDHGAVTIEPAGGGVITYTYLGKKVRFEEFKGLVEKQFMSSLDENDPFYMVFRDDVPLSVILDARALLQSMPFRKIRLFCFSPEGGVMTELEVKRGYPFSRDPSPQDLEKPTR